MPFSLVDKAVTYAAKFQKWAGKPTARVWSEDKKFPAELEAQGRNLMTTIHPDDEMCHFFTTRPDHRRSPLQSYIISGEGMLQCPDRIFGSALTMAGNTFVSDASCFFYKNGVLKVVEKFTA